MYSDDSVRISLNLIQLYLLSMSKLNFLLYSGGQQRRVSFAVALMHDPELLILDEPTVGVDPLLRQSIWTHLVRITSSGDKTVIITTHYIEEARQAHSVSLHLHCKKNYTSALEVDFLRNTVFSRSGNL